MKFRFFLFLIVMIAAPMLAAASEFVPPGGGGPPPGGSSVPPFDNPLGTGGLLGIICNVRNALFPVLLVFGVLAFIIAGLLYLTAGGNDQRVSMAKTALIGAVIGVLLAFLSFGLPSIVANVFGVDPTALPASCL